MVFGAAIFASFLWNFFGIGVPRIDIVVSATEVVGANSWTVRGKVLFEGNGISKAKVWVIVRDSQGNRFSPETVTANDHGDFNLKSIPAVISGTNGNRIIEVAVFASGEVEVQIADGPETEPKTIKGEEILGLGNTGRTRWVQLSPTALFIIPTIFFTSLMLGLIRFSPVSTFAPKLQYYGSVGLGVILTITMVAYISAGLYMVSVSASPGDALSLGFATIFHGTYVENVDPQWLFSLTAPRSNSEVIVEGLGAPLWVLLLSVLGSGVFTVSIVVNHIGGDIDLSSDSTVRPQVQEVIKYQFYVHFSPLGAVIVYQLLVVAGAATQTVTVAIAAIAAGVALNGILNKAIQAVTNLLSQDRHMPGKKAVPTDKEGE